MALLTDASYRNYKEQPVSFVVDTTYAHWNTDFPAISACEVKSDKLYDVAERMYGRDRDMNMDLFLKDMAFFDGTCHSCAAHCDKGHIQCPSDLPKIVRQVRSTCRELMTSCSWNGDPIDCCTHFRPMLTEMGPCYVFNSALSVQTPPSYFRRGGKSSSIRKRKFFSNRKTGPGVLYFQTNYSIKSPKSALTARMKHVHALKNEQFLSEYDRKETDTKEVKNEVGVEGLEVSQRLCRFPWEKPNGSIPLYEQYSYSTCVVECHATAQMDMCNCTDHFIPTPPGWNHTCTVKGLACITKYQSTLRSLRTSWSKKPGLVCDCDSGCMEPEYTIVEKTKIPQPPTNPPMITVRMSALPSERFRRSIVRTRLDLVVSLGGTAGLFLGASILSVAEILYHLTIMITQIRQKKRVHPKFKPPPKISRKTTNDNLHLQPSFYM
ncbi:pickpocket protein 19-like [Ischnura elegans]|uniref:pickpocket protein 19-like n=1 Tax=Ischnura elegans TaxID=197161 RepID=UPI001ED88340|nr:pickpocket protein 19-like [Ischnura elegans]